MKAAESRAQLFRGGEDSAHAVLQGRAAVRIGLLPSPLPIVAIDVQLRVHVRHQARQILKAEDELFREDWDLFGGLFYRGYPHPVLRHASRCLLRVPVNIRKDVVGVTKSVLCSGFHHVWAVAPTEPNERRNQAYAAGRRNVRNYGSTGQHRLLQLGVE